MDFVWPLNTNYLLKFKLHKEKNSHSQEVTDFSQYFCYSGQLKILSFQVIHTSVLCDINTFKQVKGKPTQWPLDFETEWTCNSYLM